MGTDKGVRLPCHDIRRTGLIWTAKAEASEPKTAEAVRNAEAKKINFYEVRIMTTTIRDLSYRLEGYEDIPEYEIKMIKVCADGEITIQCRRNEAKTSETTEQAQDGTAEAQGAQNESDE